eukprot:1332750-Lingulodinium_polyedra.AAC.1
MHLAAFADSARQHATPACCKTSSSRKARTLRGRAVQSTPRNGQHAKQALRPAAQNSAQRPANAHCQDTMHNA